MYVLFEKGSGGARNSVKGPFKEVRFTWGGRLGIFVDGGRLLATFDQRSGSGVYVINGEPSSTLPIGDYFEVARVVDHP
jgi:hypothetical protein